MKSLRAFKTYQMRRGNAGKRGQGGAGITAKVPCRELENNLCRHLNFKNSLFIHSMRYFTVGLGD